MTIAELLTSLRERDIRLSVEDGRLRCSAPVGSVTPEIRATLESRKAEILAVLESASAVRSGPPAIVPIKPRGRRAPLFGFPGHNGDVFCFAYLARELDAEQPLIGLQPPGLDGKEPLESIEDLAAYHAGQIREYRPDGPYLLAGYCAGGTIAFEVARRLQAQGQRVALVALMGSSYPSTYRPWPQALRRVRHLAAAGRRHLQVLSSGSISERICYVRDKLRGRLGERLHGPDSPPSEGLANRHRVECATIAALRHYRPGHYSGEIDLFLPSPAWRNAGGRPDLWKSVAAVAREHLGPPDCPADGMLLEPHVSETARLLRLRLDEVA